jgi:hypothetical protein
MTINIGDKVRVKKGIEDHSDFWIDCDCVRKCFDYLIITANGGDLYEWDAYKNDKKNQHCSGHGLTADDFLPYNRTLDDVREDDLLEYGNEYFYRVIGRSGKAIFLTSYWKKGEKEKIDYNYVYSIQQLKNNGYTLVDETQTDDEVEKAIELLKEKGRLVDGKVLSN